MKLRSVVVVMSAALVGVTTPGFAQAGRGDGNRSQYSNGDHRGHQGNRHNGHHRSDRGDSNGLAIALGIGLLGLAIASQHDAQPQYSYGPGYAPAYPPAYPPAGYGYQGGYDGSGYANRGYSRYGHNPYAPVPINPMTGY